MAERAATNAGSDDSLTARPGSLVVEQSLPDVRLDNYLRTKFPDVSRSTLQRLLEQGDILLNGKPAKPVHHPKAGEVITIRWPEAKAATAEAQDIPLKILYEDSDLLVINKEAGIVVHPAAGNEDRTIVNAVLFHCEGNLSGIGGVLRPGIVHRLDKDTTGCLVVAKNDLAHQRLSEQFSGRTMEKIYLAICCGVLPRKSGVINAPIKRHQVQRKKMAVDPSGREAVTSYKVLEQFPKAALVEAILHTGRTHQIRVHFQHLGNPLLGDETYGERQNQKLKQDTGLSAPRQMLHAWKLKFTHPTTKETVTFKAPIPPDFTATLELLKTKQ